MYMHTTHTSEAQFLSVSLYDEPLLSYGSIFGKVHRITPNDTDMFNVKNTNMHVTYSDPVNSLDGL